MFGCYPFGHMELAYYANEYQKYVSYIKKALKIGKLFVDFVK
jgi:hypothetical protein